MFIPLDYQLVLASPWRHDRLCNDTEYLLWLSGNQWSRLPKGSEEGLVNNFLANSFFALILNLCALWALETSQVNCLMGKGKHHNVNDKEKIDFLKACWK